MCIGQIGERWFLSGGGLAILGLGGVEGGEDFKDVGAGDRGRIPGSSSRRASVTRPK